MRSVAKACLGFLAFAVCVLPALWGTAASAEIFRCVGADGSVSFSSRADACPGATSHQPRGNVQQVTTRSTRARPAAPRRSRGARAALQEEAEAARWQARKRQAVQERAQLASNAEPFRQLVTWCNRGATLHARDQHGVSEEYDCDQARAEYAALQERLVELEAYLDGGLAEECRRAGCLPGWIR